MVVHLWFKVQPLHTPGTKQPGREPAQHEQNTAATTQWETMQKIYNPAARIARLL